MGSWEHDGSSDEISKGGTLLDEKRLFEIVVDFEKYLFSADHLYIDSYQNIHVYLWGVFSTTNRKKKTKWSSQRELK